MTAALVAAALLVFVRVAAFVTFLPPFAGRNVPGTVKVGLALCLTSLWAAKIAPVTAFQFSPSVSEGWLMLTWLAARETLLGASLGWMLGLILVPVRIAGAYLAQEMGLTMGAIAAPGESLGGDAVSQVLEVGAILFIFGTNIHYQFLRLFDAAFAVFPPGGTWQLPSSNWVVGSIVRTNDLGLSIAAPVGVLLFATVIVTLYIMRQAPQFNLLSFGMPARVLVGLTALVWFLPPLITGIVHCVRNFASLRGL